MSETNHNPYATPRSAVTYGTYTPEPGRKADRSMRFAASLIDTVLTICASILLYIGLAMMEDGVQPVDIVVIVVGGVLLAALVVYQLVLLARHSQTVGKRLLGIRIVRSDGAPIAFGRLLGLRIVVPGLIGAIPIVGGFFSLVNVLCIFGEERRCLHDRFADTIVVTS